MQLIFSRFIVVATISDMRFLGVPYFVELGVHQINFSRKLCQIGVSQITIQIFFANSKDFFVSKNAINFLSIYLCCYSF
jgi:hypothetical protein